MKHNIIFILKYLLLGAFCGASLLLAYKLKVSVPEVPVFKINEVFKCYDCKYFEELAEDCNLQPIKTAHDNAANENTTIGILFAFNIFGKDWDVKEKYLDETFSLVELWVKLKNGDCKVR